jgi:protein-tyrosine phosphatase
MAQSVLFVCMGNICRSPTAEGVARRMAEDMNLAVEFDSAGTLGYHVGEAPDKRSIAAAARRGYELGSLRARQVDLSDFDRFDLVLAMDENNLRTLLEICPPARRDRVRKLLDFADAVAEIDVPDPYYGGADGFEFVVSLIERGVKGLLENLQQK